MFSDERRDKILELLQKNGRVLAKELADMFELSIDSIRRDLSIMEEKGLLKRTHGGAIPALKVRNTPFPPDLRYKDGAPHQNAISKLAASFIKEKDTVFIGSAGIHYGMLKYLPDVPFTVVTNSIQVAATLKDREALDVYLVGGKVKGSGSITDTLANEFLRQFTLDICFVTGGGISKNGVSTSTPEVAALGRAAVEISRKKICLAPHEKLGIDFFAKEGPITDIDLLITDEEADIDAIEEVESKGVKVFITRINEESQ
ncbi:DeoR/GlpR family DNA-binding transcription regulator [Paenibacillus sp. LHD-38]|uniref:DeoR/GlpR family DNA-binding transcription regulator n=1 Tax=Paenibacillus sp. LHD-38 TaxID=3072143 RepID=UPI00280EE02A|nr:DeoR/GlpR family DNA-binding transcription regulator [Paenibacillus sp. LHD-38]MDQ8739387.1 DeoR/GlpR family DNA-binding transcription regulator [Paenibacillus sp. LHD-38]